MPHDVCCRAVRAGTDEMFECWAGVDGHVLCVELHDKFGADCMPSNSKGLSCVGVAADDVSVLFLGDELDTAGVTPSADGASK